MLSMPVGYRPGEHYRSRGVSTVTVLGESTVTALGESVRRGWRPRCHDGEETSTRHCLPPAAGGEYRLAGTGTGQAGCDSSFL